MNSLSELNNLSKVLISFIDQRPAGIELDRDIFDYYYPVDILYRTKAFTPPVNIVDVINPLTANVRYRVEVKTARDPLLSGTTITWNALPTGVTASQSGQQFTLTGLQSASDWELIKSYSLTFPVNYTTCPLWYIETSIIYFDQELQSDQTYSWVSFDPRFFYTALFKSTSSLEVSKIENVTLFNSIMYNNTSLYADGQRIIPKTASIFMYSNFTVVGNIRIIDLGKQYLDSRFVMNVNPVVQPPVKVNMVIGNTLTAIGEVFIVNAHLKATTALMAAPIQYKGLITNLIGAFSPSIKITYSTHGYNYVLPSAFTLSATAKVRKTFKSTATSTTTVYARSRVDYKPVIGLSSVMTVNALGGKKLNNPAAISSTFTLSASPTIFVSNLGIPRLKLSNRRTHFEMFTQNPISIISDPNYSGNYTVQITTNELSTYPSVQKSRFSISDTVPGTIGYTFTGTRAEVNANLASLIFYPSDNMPSTAQSLNAIIVRITQTTGFQLCNRPLTLTGSITHTPAVDTITSGLVLRTTSGTDFYNNNSYRYYGSVSLIAAGGGGGGSRGAGGGSGGVYISTSTTYNTPNYIYLNDADLMYENPTNQSYHKTTNGNISYTIGSGGLSGDNNPDLSNNGTNGTDTIFLAVTAKGGNGAVYNGNGGASGQTLFNSSVIINSIAGGTGSYLHPIGTNVGGIVIQSPYTEYPAGGGSYYKGTSQLFTKVPLTISSTSMHDGTPGAGLLSTDSLYTFGGGGGGGGVPYSTILTPDLWYSTTQTHLGVNLYPDGDIGATVNYNSSGQLTGYTDATHIASTYYGQGGGGGIPGLATSIAKPSNGASGAIYYAITCETDIGYY